MMIIIISSRIVINHEGNWNGGRRLGSGGKYVNALAVAVRSGESGATVMEKIYWRNSSFPVK